ncbi:MAG: 7,8-didemethyl-8-hydroxy-5-deazariboflavin synthase CofG [Candidatus Eremiobacterota bacterium]
MKKLLHRERLEPEDARRLMGWPLDELDPLLEAAGALRDRGHGRHVTYSRKVFLPVTNLCRDRCSYCTFRKGSRDPRAWTMSPDEIREQSRRARAAGCKEALMCLGDRPETAYPAYRVLLAGWGASSTAEYVHRACTIALEEGLLPHTNAGVLTRDEMSLLRPVNVSMGLMLENVSPRLRDRGMAHASAPDKDPTVRLSMIQQAGELAIPFTTGLLLGIGETLEERADTLASIRDLADRWGHIQEVIVQAFRAKPDIPMARYPEPSDLDLARTIAVTRLYLGASFNVQAPPNLSPHGHALLLRGGINDWGGISPVTRDYINPEAPWPHLEALARTCAENGFTLGERLAVYPEFIRPEWLDPAMGARVGV